MIGKGSSAFLVDFEWDWDSLVLLMALLLYLFDWFCSDRMDIGLSASLDLLV